MQFTSLHIIASCGMFTFSMLYFVALAYQLIHLHLHLSRSLVDRWGATDDLAISSPIPVASQPSSWRRPASCQFIPGCCPPMSFSVCLFFSLLALGPAGWSWQALYILLRARTISVCVALLWSGGLRGAQWLAEFYLAPFRWRCRGDAE